MDILLYIISIWNRRPFYNVPYFRKALTAFWQAEAVHLGVSSRHSHCIIMRFPAPKCYFAGRCSSLKLHHYYNFPNFYFLHYCQQDFITYLECKQAWVMTPSVSPPPLFFFFFYSLGDISLFPLKSSGVCVCFVHIKHSVCMCQYACTNHRQENRHPHTSEAEAWFISGALSLILA